VESDISIWANGDFFIWRLHQTFVDRTLWNFPKTTPRSHGRVRTAMNGFQRQWQAGAKPVDRYGTQLGKALCPFPRCRIANGHHRMGFLADLVAEETQGVANQLHQFVMGNWDVSVPL
jgi:hypothetical protein